MKDIEWQKENGVIHQLASGAKDPDDIYTAFENVHLELSEQAAGIKPEDVVAALYLMADGLLPEHAYQELAALLLKGIDEAHDKKYTLKTLGIYPPKSGRKSTTERDIYIVRSVFSLITKGVAKADAYQQLADECFVSVDTVRRIYERKISERKQRGNR